MVNESQKNSCQSIDEEFKNCQDVMKIPNQFGRFQIKILFLLCPILTLMGMQLISFVFLTATPSYECRQEGLNYTCSEANKESYSKLCNRTDNDRCTRFKLESCLNMFNETEIYSNVSEEYCFDGWKFNTENSSTVVSEFELVCQNGWKRPLLISLFMVGTLFGSLFGGHASDKFGRRRLVLFAFTLHSLFQAILSFSPFYWFFILFSFLLGIFSVVVYLCTYIWVQEFIYCSEKRSLAAFCMNVAFALGCPLVSLVAYVLPDWYWLLRFLALLGFAYLPLVWWLVPESTTWFLQSKKIKEASSVLKKIARSNKISVDENELYQMLSTEHSNKNDNIEVVSPFTLWRVPVLRRRILIVCYLWTGSLLSYYTVILNTSNLGGNVYINNLIGGAIDLTAATIMMLLLKKFSRRNTTAFFSIAVCVFSISSPLIKQASLIGGISCAMAGRLFSTASMFVVIFYSGEIFPTLLRSTSYGIASMSSRISSILSPFLIYIGEEIDLAIPFYVIGGACIVSACLSFLLPETSNAPLPETIEDAIKLEERTALSIRKARKLSLKDGKKTDDFLI